MAKWSPGRQGDLRDVWRVAANGPVGEGGEEDGLKVGKVLVVRGREEVKTIEMGSVTESINGLGSWVRGKKEGASVAVCLSNSVELLVCVFGKSTIFLLSSAHADWLWRRRSMSLQQELSC